MSEPAQLALFLGIWAIGVLAMAVLFWRGRQRLCIRCQRREQHTAKLCLFCYLDARGSLLI